MQPNSIPGDLMRQYYEQRASDGGFLLTEATNVSLASRGWLGAPGLYTAEQVKGWRAVTDAVHRKGAHIFAQLWHTGRSSHLSMTGGSDPVAPSVDSAYWQDPGHLVSTPGGWVQPSPHRALTVAEIAGIIEDFRRAAGRAMDAGFAARQLRPYFHGKLLAAGGFEPDTAEAAILGGQVDAVSFGRHFLAKPDLPRRVRENLPLTPYDRSTFYTFEAHGYTDYPTYDPALTAA